MSEQQQKQTLNFFDSTASRWRRRVEEDKLGGGRVMIVMYHYVRDPAATRFPKINAITPKQFRAQLNFLHRHFFIATINETVEAFTNGGELPGNAVLLSFDDGYADHYRFAFPILQEVGVSGVFFPCARPTTERRPLVVNKIQFVLASSADLGELLAKVRSTMTAVLGERRFDQLWVEYAKPSRFDDAEIAFAKRMLQDPFLPDDVRVDLVDSLFKEAVTEDEVGFAEELYMTSGQITEMASSGMHFGVHGYEHRRWPTLSSDARRLEMTEGRRMLRDCEADSGPMVLCYPHGAYDEATKQDARSLGFSVGLSTDLGTAEVGKHDPLALPRMNTNDLPKS